MMSRKPMTPLLLCLKIGKLTGNEPEMWMKMNMQAKYNLWEVAPDRTGQKTVAHVPNYRELETA